MKTPSSAEYAALRAQARRIPLHSADDLERAVRRVVRRYRIPGLSLVLCHPDGRDTFLHTGHARLAERTDVTRETCFRVASVSKLVMSFGALALMERGLLALDEDVGTYLGYAVRSPHAPDVPVTLRTLLTHTAGITDTGSYAARGLSGAATLRELLADGASWLPQRPGAAFRYSNLGAGVAGCIMERAAGMPFDMIMQQFVFEPLGIRASYDPRAIHPTGDLANGYSVRGILPPRLRYDAAALAARPPEPFDPERDYLIAAGRMITDSPGMARLIRLLSSEDGMGVLSPASLALMRTPQRGLGGIGDVQRGLNIAFLPDVFPGVSALGHQGVAYGMVAELFADPQKHCGVGVMTSGMRLTRALPLMRGGLELLALGFAAVQLRD